MRTITADELKTILRKHWGWLKGEKQGECANLRDAKLRGVDLQDADLRGVDLHDAELSGANLYGANLRGAILPHFSVCPEEGAFIAWKKCADNVLVKLEVPAEAKRTSSLVGRKCRAEFVRVLEVIGGEKAVSWNINVPRLEYRVGEIVYPDKYDDDIRVECSNGIHFFITRREAEEFK